MERGCRDCCGVESEMGGASPSVAGSAVRRCHRVRLEATPLPARPLMRKTLPRLAPAGSGCRTARCRGWVCRRRRLEPKMKEGGVVTSQPRRYPPPPSSSCRPPEPKTPLPAGRRLSDGSRRWVLGKKVEHRISVLRRCTGICSHAYAIFAI
ncbi:hypothetical protein ACLOJK_023840 [Asimina triloba]